MVKVEITKPGERVIDDFTSLVKTTVSPTTAQPVNVGLVEISQTTPTNLVPGPVGPQGPRGSRWFTGDGPPTITGALLGDMYLDDVTGQIWTWDGSSWINTGTDLSPDASELLTKIKTVDGSGSGLDADTLDGQDGTYYLDYDNLTDKPTSFPPSTHTHPQSDITNLVPDLALKAPLASPTFTGDPKAPTPATADNDTSIATTAYVKANLATIVGGAIISDTPPGSPQAGQLWYESDSGNTYIWYNDGNTSQWVQVNILPPFVAPPPLPPNDGDQYVMVNGVWQKQTGVVKISSGVGAAGAASFDVALPTGYQSFELQIMEFQPVATVSLTGNFSWDGGATFPNASGSYSLVYMQASTVNAGPSEVKAATSTNLVFGPSQGASGSAKKGQYRIWIPVVDAAGRAGAQFTTDSYTGSDLRISNGMGTWIGTGNLGPPNALRLGMGASTLNTALRWQLNGVR